jgi:hypothetical protein
VKRIGFLICLWTLVGSPAAAYDLLLDIDADGDPSTLVTATEAASADLRLVLAPSAGPEWIAAITFGLGGTCWECFEHGSPFTYGCETDIFGVFTDWHESPLFASSWGDVSLCLGCCDGAGDGPGYHFIYDAEAADGGFWLTAPIFIAGFRAWVSDSPVFERCPRPPADLITFPLLTQGSGNRVLFGNDNPPTPAASRSWSALKALY